jgi:hypothetical protein
MVKTGDATWSTRSNPVPTIIMKKAAIMMKPNMKRSRKRPTGPPMSLHVW